MPLTAADAYFANLKNGDTIETPFLVRFGVSGGWGLAPIAKASNGKSGHHHLLVNRDLPLNFKTALPFTDQYIHFGKGQMETVLNLAPGTYSLRLLLADDQHIPHFVYSREAKITVTKQNSTDPKTLIKKGIDINIDEGDTKAFRVRFHASGLNVAHLEQKLPDTGHFRLSISSSGSGKPEVMDFVNGQTEIWLSPPAGAYTFSLDFVDNLDPAKVIASATPRSVNVP